MDLKTLKERIILELDISVFLKYILENSLISPQLIESANNSDYSELKLNKYIASKEVVSFNERFGASRVNVVCPFHDTKSNDSSYYYLSSNLFTCKSANCSMGSKKQHFNVIDICQMLVFNVPPGLLYLEGNTTFVPALKLCAEILGIEWSFEKRSYTEEEKKEFRRLAVYKNFIEVTHDSFKKKNKFSRRAREYLLYERGFIKLGLRKVIDLIKVFEIGYAGGKYGSTFMYKIMKKRGFTDEELLNSGLFVNLVERDFENNTSQQTDTITDFFYNRIIFGYKRKGNIYDGVYGRNIQFKKEIENARATMSQEKFEEFNKKMKSRRHLRNFGVVSELINFHVASNYEKVIFVEGELDFLTFYGLDFLNVVAGAGTNGISQKDIDTLKLRKILSKNTVCKTIYLCFDNDDNDAGEKAMFTVGLDLLKAGFDVRVVRLVDGDPNDALINHGLGAKEVLQKALDDAISFEAFFLRTKLSKCNFTSFASIKSELNAVRDFFETIPKQELLFIVLDFISDLKKFTNVTIDDSVLLYAFGLLPNSESNSENSATTTALYDSVNPREEVEQKAEVTVEENVDATNEDSAIVVNEENHNTKEEFVFELNKETLIDLEHLNERNWVIVFDDINRFNYFKKMTNLPNVIFTKDVPNLNIYLENNFKNISNIILDSVSETIIFEEWKKTKFSIHYFVCPNFSDFKGEFSKYIKNSI